MINKLKLLFFQSILGDLYFKYLLWVDRIKDKNRLRYLTPKEIQQILKEYSLIDEGVKEIKSKVNALVKSKNSQEYNKVLQEIEDLTLLASRTANDPKTQFANLLKSKIDLSNVQIKNTTDFAKMIDTRIKDMYALQEDKLKRQLMRQLRQAQKVGDLGQVSKLKLELKEKYNVGRTK